MLEKISNEIKALPKTTQDLVTNKIKLYVDSVKQKNLNIPDNIKFLQTLPKVWCCSLFIAENCIRSPELIESLISSGDLFSSKRKQNYFAFLNSQKVDSYSTLMRILRQFRAREMVRIGWRDLSGWSNLNETLTDLTELAQTCISFALDFLYQQACINTGTPKNQNGTPINIVVLGMGKLGAFELNYSSDIDLIFAYAKNGVLNDRKKTTYAEFFSQICRLLIKALNETTRDGLVFRTDMRLRPFGSSGPIIMSFAAMENYYLTQAREWERYAMVKARPVAGDFVSAKLLMDILRPFVYRRYLDYGAFTELRSLKAKITKDIEHKEQIDNIKLGIGGIREIEFIGQVFQLIRGGKETKLQSRSIIKILKLLAKIQLLPYHDSSQLQTAYCFLRQTENHIQQYQDRQTHNLPSTKLAQEILAFSLDFPDCESFKLKLQSIREDVHKLFIQVFSLSQPSDNKNNAEKIWLEIDTQNVEKYLLQIGFKQTHKTCKTLSYFKNSRSISRLTTKGYMVIERLIPLLINAVGSVQNKTTTIKRVLDLFEQVAGRNVYLALLVENPSALSKLVKLASASHWVCQYLSQYPMLFDELLDTRSIHSPLNKQQLSKQLKDWMAMVEDEEQLLIKLRQFKQLNVFRVATADIMGVMPIMLVGDSLTYIAEVIVEFVVDSAWNILRDKYGLPTKSNNINKHFAVIGFGKLGSLELGYDSDLDLVFLYDYTNSNALTKIYKSKNHNTKLQKSISCGQFYRLLGQKIRHILDTKMLSGILYKLDMRLRPNGNSGLLVTSLASYKEYMKNSAWAWEHQALIRARFIAGDNKLEPKFTEIRNYILSLSRNIETLKQEIIQMRHKMHLAQIKKSGSHFDLKQNRGGIIDIEFIVQFQVLAQTAKNQELTRFTDNINLLKTLNKIGLLTDFNTNTLKHAYCTYRHYTNHQVLQGVPMLEKNNVFVTTQSKVKQIWDEIFKPTLQSIN